MLPTLQLARAALSRWYTWNCSPPYARITSSIARLLVSFAGTKHCCLTAVNRGGALCCPDFPRDRGLKPEDFLPLPRDRPTHYLHFAAPLKWGPRKFIIFGESGGTSRPMPQAAVIATLLPNAQSGIRESNPPPRLGKPMHYRCANAAKKRCKVTTFF